MPFNSHLSILVLTSLPFLMLLSSKSQIKNNISSHVHSSVLPPVFLEHEWRRNSILCISEVQVTKETESTDTRQQPLSGFSFPKAWGFLQASGWIAGQSTRWEAYKCWRSTWTFPDGWVSQRWWAQDWRFVSTQLSWRDISQNFLPVWFQGSPGDPVWAVEGGVKLSEPVLPWLTSGPLLALPTRWDPSSSAPPGSRSLASHTLGRAVYSSVGEGQRLLQVPCVAECTTDTVPACLRSPPLHVGVSVLLA